MSNIAINRFKTLDLIKSTPYFKCSFTKKDNSTRNMICSFNENISNNNSLVSVWDIEKDDYRYINLDTLINIRIGKILYTVV